MDTAVIKPLMRGWSHVLAFTVVAVLGIIMLVVAGASASERVWLGVYVAGTLTMFGISAAYHTLPLGPHGRSIMRRLDHSAIFLAIAGAYTPIMAVALTGWQKVVVLSAAWGGAVVGMTLEWVPLKVPRPLFTAIYVIVGWSAALAFPQLYRHLGGTGFALVLG
ncbi:MAG: PAQR family membrane homeostasis protein TrhA, partial [Ilumatobacteraceae bacterium]